mmetsp:Transcript_59569/g.122062  ORF Transcript_59569/g.122062 Transcript_59569/m.122062 type:complete len:383 (+) Transcript_59569:97-1245(+)
MLAPTPDIQEKSSSVSTTRPAWLATLLGVLGFTLIGAGFIWLRVQHLETAKRRGLPAHPPKMDFNPLARCQAASEYTIRNGKAALRPNRRSHHEEGCRGISPTNALVVPTTAECPFLMSVYRPSENVYDIVSNSIRIEGLWEPRESGIIEDLPENSFMVDIGANIGWHTLLALSLGHRVLAFEPFLENVKLLNHSLCMNPGFRENLELHEIALSDSSDCMLGSSSANAGDGVLLCGEEAQKNGDHDRLSAVRVGRLDEILKLGVQVDLIKIDVEGHELAALRSGERLFQKRNGHTPPAYIVSEWSPKAMEALGYNPLDLLLFFADHNYQVLYRERVVDKWNLAWKRGEGTPRAEEAIPREKFAAFLAQHREDLLTIEAAYRG